MNTTDYLIYCTNIHNSAKTMPVTIEYGYFSERKYEEAIDRIYDNEKAITDAKQQYTYGDKRPKITDYIAFEKYEKEIDTVLQDYRDIPYEGKEYIRIMQRD